MEISKVQVDKAIAALEDFANGYGDEASAWRAISVLSAVAYSALDIATLTAGAGVSDD